MMLRLVTLISAAGMRAARLALWSYLALSPASAAPQPFDTDHKESINGTTLHFRVRGEDPANPYLLILHGGPGFSAHMFYDWGRYLEKRLNVVYLDQRGCGESAHYRFASPLAPTKEEARDFSIANLLKDIEGVRTFLKLQRWYVLGHSWGGMLGIAYVAGHPHRVLGYVHMDGMISVPMTRESVLANAERNLTRFAEAKEKQRRDAAEQGLAIVRQLRSLPQDDAQRLFGALSLAMGPGELYFPRDQQARFAAFTAKMMEAIARYKVPFEALLAFEPGLALVQNDGFLMKDVRPLLSAISAPSLVINGEQDGVITPQMARIVHQAVSSSRLVLLDECGHFPFADRPAEAAREILKLVGSRR